MNRGYQKAGVIGLAVLILCVVLGAAIHKKQNSTGVIKKQEETVILPVLISGGDASWENSVENTARTFMEKNPDIRVVVKAAVNAESFDYQQSLNLMEALGEFQGIVEMRNVELYAGLGKLAPLPPELVRLAEHTKTVEGKVYSIPRFYTCQGVIYNKKIFDRYGLQEPSTYEEFLQICKTLKRHGVYPLTAGMGDSWHWDLFISGLFANDVKKQEPLWIDKRNHGQVHWTDEAPMQMLSDIKEIFDSGYVDHAYKTTTDSQTVERLVEEKAAMLYSGNWMFSQIYKAQPDFDMGWFPLPAREGDPYLELNGNVEWSITNEYAKDPKSYEAAVRFLTYFYSPENYREVLFEMNGISALAEKTDNPFLPVQQKAMKYAAKYGVIQNDAISSGKTPEGFASQMYLQMTELAEGRSSVQETAEFLDRLWDKKLQQNKEYKKQ
ncbi:ABC transporter substrate-binding protein [Lacrimispora sp. JR3]|uniref:ABC transporter substrate-binding protein n=1 Tax=Lacrimispora sinapis TaxID=3111456 RepID=UPI0037478712